MDTIKTAAEQYNANQRKSAVNVNISVEHIMLYRDWRLFNGIIKAEICLWGVASALCK